VDHQVYNALRSADYGSILEKIAKRHGPSAMTFTKESPSAELTPPEAKKFGNFLQKMKRMNVIRPGEARGEYEFTVPMLRFYIWLQTVRAEKRASGRA
jgi:hypothetical protein